MKRKIKRLDLRALNENFYTITRREMLGIVGGGTGSAQDPYTYSEYQDFICDNTRTWTGGFVIGMGYVWPDTICTPSTDSYNIYSSAGSYSQYYWNTPWGDSDSQLSYITYFDVAVRHVFYNEGGYSNDPNDKGGVTNMGITNIFLNEYNYAITGTKPNSVSEVTWRQAYEMYNECWKKNKMDQIRDSKIADIIFDGIVNTGVNGIKVVQTALQKLGQHVDIDGKMGQKTIDAINYCIGNVLFNEIKYERIEYYKSLKDPNHQSGWEKRMDTFFY